MTAPELVIALRRAADAWNRGDVDGWVALFDPAVELHGFPDGLPPGLEGARRFYEGLARAFPGGRLQLDDVVAASDRVALRFTLRGEHRGAFAGVGATGRQVAMQGQAILHFHDGRCVECWQALDEAGLMRQLGLMPLPGYVPATPIS